MREFDSDANERGAVLLTTLLVMSIMAALAVALLDDVKFAVKRAVNVQSYAQADWYVLAAEDFAASYLSQALEGTTASQLNVALLDNEPIVFPIEGGAIALSVQDGSQCFSLGALSASPGRRQFRSLLEVLGWDTLSAAALTSAAIDWADADTQTLPDGGEDYAYLGQTPAYRTANSEFSSVMELRALKGMTEEKYQDLRPFLCARPSADSAAININTLKPEHAPLLAGLLGGNSQYALAIQIIADRPAEGYANMEALLASTAMSDADLKDANLPALSFEPEHIWVEAEILYLDARRSAILEFKIDDDGVTRTFRRFNAEASRPQLDPEPS